MKKILSSILLLGILFFSTGCDNKSDTIIYTTVYPVHFLLETLYQENATMESIYPNGADVNHYELTDKQIDTIKNSTLFVYNGTTNEKQIAKQLVNKNRKLKIIDVAYSLKYKYGVEELWLSPSNYLMLATNLKNNLEEQIGTKYINEEIEQKYDELEEKLSIMDAEIRSIAKNARSRGQDTIITSSNLFKFLEDYGFTVISLEDYQVNTPGLSSIKSNFQAKIYQYVLSSDGQRSELTDEVVSAGSATEIKVPLMHTLSEEKKKNNETYFTIMNSFISDLKLITNY